MIGVLRISLLVEAAAAAMLTLRFADGYGEPCGRAAYLGLFHAVSAFNNAGFGLYADSLMRFVGDPLICLPICAAIIIGGIGFPVLFELRRALRTPRKWSLQRPPPTPACGGRRGRLRRTARYRHGLRRGSGVRTLPAHGHGRALGPRHVHSVRRPPSSVGDGTFGPIRPRRGV
ncbi:potassium transporter TrkG [Actinoplanes sp. NPDC024001]|uniref:potassium transporter TrkG n=1 Tax=Actinoplanes sp. NPDC024001 TaxID=3154598 RepID=UPI0033F82DFF